jgi:DNA-binding NarL/FixJ family response regulator
MQTTETTDTTETDGPGRKLAVLIVDDHDVVHWGFRLLFSQQPWVTRCLSARTAQEALGHTRRFEPHVALVDLFVGDESGADICELLRHETPAPNVLLISGAGRISQSAARAAGASGFVSKDWSSTEIVRAVRMVGLGKTVFPPQADRPTFELSSREREVLDLMASGATNREIAGSLFLSPNTVKEHTSGLYHKLDARNRTEAVRRAQRLGLLS